MNRVGGMLGTSLLCPQAFTSMSDFAYCFQSLINSTAHQASKTIASPSTALEELMPVFISQCAYFIYLLVHPSY
jgi:hypothetical protein